MSFVDIKCGFTAIVYTDQWGCSSLGLALLFWSNSAEDWGSSFSIAYGDCSMADIDYEGLWDSDCVTGDWLT